LPTTPGLSPGGSCGFHSRLRGTSDCIELCHGQHATDHWPR
jgi:hypothetical protein